MPKVTPYQDRLERLYPELRGLYMELYRDEKAFTRFMRILKRAYTARSRSLKNLDARRERDPGWISRQNMLGMQAYTECFGGTLQGVRSGLGYLKETGVTCLHLMPLMQSPQGKSDGGYAVSDYCKVEPALGTMEDLEALTADCRRRGIAVCLDFVLNHTSEDHLWARKARQGDRSYQDRYFFFDDWTLPGIYEQNLPQVFPTTAPGNFTFCREAGKVVMTTFYPYQWDLNYRNPAVLNDMTENLLYLCNRGVDLIRLDAVPYIWKTPGTNCRNLPEVHHLVRLMRLACELVCPGTALLGEVVMAPEQVAPYFGTADRPECHLLYNVTTMASTWHTVATRDVRLLRHQLDAVCRLPRQYVFLNYLRCHDDIGWGLDYDYLRCFGSEEVPHKKYLNDYFRGLEGYNEDARGELYNDDPRLGDARLCGTAASLCGIEGAREAGDAERLARAVQLDRMLHCFLLSQSGIPVIYSGDEIGQLNDNGYKDDPNKAADSRYIHRGPMNWAAAERRTDPSTTEGQLYGSIRKLLRLRKAHQAFSPAADIWTADAGNDHVLLFGRYYRGEKILCLFNFSPESQPAWLPEAEEFTDLLSKKRIRARRLRLPPYGMMWLSVQYPPVPELHSLPELRSLPETEPHGADDAE